MEVGPAAPHHQDQGDPGLLTEVPGPLQEGGDGLLFPGDDLLHQLVPHHEVGGGGVLVHQQQGAARLQRLHDVGGLGGAAAGVQGGEPGGVPSAGQVVDEQGDVRACHLPAVLRPDLYGGVVGDDILPPVPGDVVVNAPLQGLQQGGLAVVAAPGDEGDPPGHPHAPEGPPVGQVQRHRHGLRGLEGDGVPHGPVGHAALPGQNGAVRHKSGQFQPFQLSPDEMLVLRQGDDLGHLSLGSAGIQQALLHTDREKIKENFLQLLGVDGSSVGWEPHLKTQNDRPGAHLAIRPLQHLLAGRGDGQNSAFAGALGLPGKPSRLPGKAPEQIILQCRPVPWSFPALGREACGFAVKRHAELGGGGKGIALDVFNVQHIGSKGPAPRQGFVGRVAPVINGTQGRTQFFRCFHGKTPLSDGLSASLPCLS